MTNYLDSTQWPIAIVTWEPGFTTEDVKETLGAIVRLHDRMEPWALCVDMTKVDHLSKEQQKLFGEYNNAHREIIRTYRRGLAFAMTSVALRTLVNATILLSRPPTPVRTFATREEAVAWLKEGLREESTRKAV